MAKKKSKIKKFLKTVAPLAIAGLGAAALGRAKNRKASIADIMAKEFGFGQMKLKDFGPYSTKRGFVPVNMMTPQDMANDEMFQNVEMMKKGGRVRKTKKGGRAVRKANRSKKK